MINYRVTKNGSNVRRFKDKQRALDYARRLATNKGNECAAITVHEDRWPTSKEVWCNTILEEERIAQLQKGFIERYNHVKNSVIKAMDDALDRAISNKVFDFNKMEDNYADVYPLIAAVLQSETAECLEGSMYEDKVREQKKKAKEYLNDLRIWKDYAGDYKDNAK